MTCFSPTALIVPELWKVGISGRHGFWSIILESTTESMALLLFKVIMAKAHLQQIEEAEIDCSIWNRYPWKKRFIHLYKKHIISNWNYSLKFWPCLECTSETPMHQSYRVITFYKSITYRFMGRENFSCFIFWKG